MLDISCQSAPFMVGTWFLETLLHKVYLFCLVTSIAFMSVNGGCSRVIGRTMMMSAIGPSSM